MPCSGSSVGTCVPRSPALPLNHPQTPLQVIADVLAEYGDNIDAAIKHLTDLRLSAASSSAAISEQAAAMAAAAAEQHQQQQQQQSAAEAPSSNGGGTATTAVPKSAEEWVDFVVHEMAAAKDMADARARASKVLQAFEQAAVQHSKHQVRWLLGCEVVSACH